MDGSEKPEPKPVANEPLDLDMDLPEQTPSELAKSSEPFQKFKQKRRRNLIITIVILLVVGVGAYFLLNKDKPVEQTNVPGETTQEQQTTTAPQTISEQTMRYSSSKFFLSFDYPADWTVAEAPDGSTLTVKSPELSLKDASGQNVDGQIVFMIRNKEQKMPEFDAGNATAVRASEKIAYTKPGPTQRGETFVSFLGYAGSTNGGMDGIFITGDTGYKVDQAVPKADFIPVDPIINYSFIDCDGSCGAEPLSVSPDIWEDPAIGGQLKKMLQSLIIQ